MKRIERIPLDNIARLRIYINTLKKSIRQVKEEEGADYATNLVYFTDKWKGTCQLKSGGTVYARDQYNYDGFAWDRGGDIFMVSLPAQGTDKQNYFACMGAIVAGKPKKLYYNADVAGKRGRVAFAITTDRELLLYCSHDGADADTPEGVRDELAARGDIVSAVIGDGGTKAALIGPNGNVEGAEDVVQNILLVYLKKETEMDVKTYSKKKSGGVKLSENFRVSEFACHDGSDTVLVSSELVELLQKIRDHFGRAVTINSGYRTAAWNASHGGAAKSQHLLGTAADITISGVTPLEVAQYAEFMQPDAGGIGLYQSFTHVDVRAVRSRWDNRSGKQVVVSGWPGYTEPTELEKAVDKLAGAGIINSPDYWKGGNCTADTVRLLIIKMAAAIK